MEGAVSVEELVRMVSWALLTGGAVNEKVEVVGCSY